MDEKQDGEETTYIPISGKQLGIALAAIFTFISSIPLANYLTYDVRNDPFTGADGKLLYKAIYELKQHDRNHRTQYFELKDLVRTYQATAKAENRSQDALISRCMALTRGNK